MVEEEKLLTIKEAAEMLRCSEGHIYRLIRRGELPTIKVGRKYTRIKKKDVLDFIEKHRKTRGKES